MIATRTEIKGLLQITDSSKDAIIDLLIPVVQDEIVDYCNSHFAKTMKNSDNTDFSGNNTISFTASTKTITDSSSSLPFANGQDIYITGSKYNDGHYTIVTAASGSVVISETLIDEAAGSAITIKLVVWPKALKTVVADMVAYKSNSKESGVVSESIAGAISTNYAEELGSYPKTLLAGLNKYRIMGFR